MKTFKNILVLCDTEKPGSALIEQAMALVSGSDTMVTLTHSTGVEPGVIANTFSGLPGRLRSHDFEAEMLALHLERLWLAGEPLRARGITTYQHVLQGTSFIEIIKKVLRDGHDLVLKVAERDEDTMARASTDLHLLRKCPCPVWLMGNSMPQAGGKILAAVAPEYDENATPTVLNKSILEFATSTALICNGRAQALSVWNLPGEDLLASTAFATLSQFEVAHVLETLRGRAESSLEQLVADNSQALGSLDLHLIKGDATEVVADFTRDQEIDLLVMGTVERKGISGLFIGSTAETILNRVDCSVLAVKPPHFETPVRLDTNVIDLADREREPKLRISA